MKIVTKAIIKSIFGVLLFLSVCGANSVFANTITKAVENTSLKSNSIISVSVKELNTGKTVYSRRADTYLNPASSLKVFTMAAALNKLGEKYNFETVVYIDKDKNLYLKLGGDPLLTSSDLDVLAKSIKQAYGGHIKHFYIDDTVIDKKYYPDGWAADDLWPNAPKVSPYIADKNTVKVNFTVQEGYKGAKSVKIIQNDDYKFSFINELEVGAVTKITPSLNYGESTGIVSLTGTVAGDFSREFPVLDTAQFFAFKLRKALDKNGVMYSKPFYPKKVPNDAKRIASFRRPINDVLSYILSSSNNFGAEVVFKVAGGGTFEGGKEMFFEYYNSLGLDDKKIRLSDASGVSRYNTLSASWMSDALVALNSASPKISDYMISANEGTLIRRMRDLNGNLKAKTGTIFGVSSLTGYVTSAAGVDYVFSIIVQNFSERASVVKGLEDDIVYGIYFLE